MRTSIEPSAEVNRNLIALGSKGLSIKTPLIQILRRPEIDHKNISALLPDAEIGGDLRMLMRASIELKYEGYIKRAHIMQEKYLALEEERIPEALFSERAAGISNEIFEKLVKLRPRTLGQASRIQGITPAAIGLIAIEIKKAGRC